MKIDQTTVVPLGWVVSGFASMLTVTIIGVVWVVKVNYRLERIEQNMHLPTIVKKEEPCSPKNLGPEVETSYADRK